MQLKPDTFPNLKGSVFIVTYGRSGSTLVQSMLQTIPSAHFSGENFAVLKKLQEASNRARRMKQTWGKRDYPSNHPWYGASKVKPARVERKLARLFIEEFIQPPADARWIGFKEIRYPSLGDKLENHLRFMRRNFPNAHFVFNSRNGKDVAKSKWWRNWKKEDVLTMVAETDARFAKYAAENPDHSQHIFYENLVKDPTCLAPVFEMLGEPMDAAALKSVLRVKLKH